LNDLFGNLAKLTDHSVVYLILATDTTHETLQRQTR